MARRTRLLRPPHVPSMPELNQWMREVYNTINDLPRFSILSTSDGPNTSGETGSKGDLLLDIGSSTTAAWVYQDSSDGTTGWVQLDLA